jgi:uncharacterized protein (DUF3820 family)
MTGRTIGENVETIVNHFLRTGSPGGKLGILVQLEKGWRVTTEGYTFIVWRQEAGWQVTFKGWAVVDDSLVTAADEAFARGKGSNMSKNYPVNLGVCA